MNNAIKFIEQAAYIFIFCMAGFLLLSQYRNINSVITTTKNEVSSENIFYEQYLDKIKETNVSYSDMITTLFGDLDYDIQINELLISKADYNYKEFNFTIIPKGEYRKSYVYNSSGDITKVIYELYQG